MQFNREEKSRLEAERREYVALKELEMLRSALATSRQQHHEVPKAHKAEAEAQCLHI